MKKKIIIIVGIVLVIVLAVILCAAFFGSRTKTLDEITLRKNGGGPLRYEVDYYTTVEITFDCTEKNGDEQTGTCYVKTNHYKDAIYSPSGKIFDHADTEEYPCSFTDYSLTIGILDNYTYFVENRNGDEYVVFSKPFFGVKSWYIDK